MLLRNCSFCLFLCLLACAEAGPPDSVTEDNVATAELNQEPGAAVTEDLPVEQDVISHTRNNDPSTIAAEKLPVPAAVTEAASAKQSGASQPDPVRPAKPAVGATNTEDKPVVEAMPAPQRPMETLSPAPAPKTDAASTSAPNSSANEEELDVVVTPDHAHWNALLQRHVSGSGDVDYAGFKQDEAKLDEYLASLAAGIPDSDWSRQEAMAYWINAYNAFTVKRILRDYPLKSITDLDGGDPWKVKWITLDGKKYSLNNIEHDILRPRYQDARIHFAVNCAAASCPPLPNKAFTAANLNGMLQSNARNFIRNTAYNQTNGDVKVSKIFEWYGEDFGNLREYLNKYLREPIAEGTEIGFMEYDWALNKQ